MSALTPDVRALLTAVHDAINLPSAATVEDEEVRVRLMDQRASDARIILAAVLGDQEASDCAEQLIGWTAEHPVTYTVWTPKQVEGGEQL